MRRRSVFGLLVLLVLSFAMAGPAWATLEMTKLYQKVFGGEKPKCTCCHTDKLPKKEAGKHDLNEYGQKLKQAKASEMPDEETFKKVGKNENAE